MKERFTIEEQDEIIQMLEDRIQLIKLCEEFTASKDSPEARLLLRNLKISCAEDLINKIFYTDEE